jgi:hypothetical protein
MKKVMSRKALSLLVMLSAGLSTSFAAPNAISDLKAYTTKLEQALILRDQPNVNAYGTAVAELVFQGKVSEAKEQKYVNQKLDKQIIGYNYDFRTTEASGEDRDVIYRALDTLALACKHENKERY